MKFSRPIGVLCALALVGCAAAGCGGGSSSSVAASSAGEPTKAAYIAEADAICQAYKETSEPLDAELKELGESEDLETPRGKMHLAELLEEEVTVGREEGQKIETLKPPSEDAGIIERWIDVGEEGLAKISGAADALEEGEGLKYKELAEEGEVLVQQAHGIAQGYGFKVCGSED